MFKKFKKKKTVLKAVPLPEKITMTRGGVEKVWDSAIVDILKAKGWKAVTKKAD